MGGRGRRRPVGEGGRRSAGFAQPLAEKEDMCFHFDREDEGQMSSIGGSPLVNILQVQWKHRLCFQYVFIVCSFAIHKTPDVSFPLVRKE